MNIHICRLSKNDSAHYYCTYHRYLLLDEFLNFKKALHLTDDANGSPNHKTHLNFSLCDVCGISSTILNFGAGCLGLGRMAEIKTARGNSTDITE